MTFARRRHDADDVFAVAVRLARVTVGLSQSQLAAHAGLSAAAIVGIERGSRVASVGEAAKLAQALDTTIDYLTFSPSGPLVKARPGRPRTSA